MLGDSGRVVTSCGDGCGEPMIVPIAGGTSGSRIYPTSCTIVSSR